MSLKGNVNFGHDHSQIQRCDKGDNSGSAKWALELLAEREGFEPPIGLHLCRISSAVHSTTLPPLLKGQVGDGPRWSGRVLGEDGGPDKAGGTKIMPVFRPSPRRCGWDDGDGDFRATFV